MIFKLVRALPIIAVSIGILSYTIDTENSSSSTNLINKLNAVEYQCIDYNGTVELDNSMIMSQFTPYDSTEDYIVNSAAYVSYYTGEEFITTELYEVESELKTIEEADGVILRFNKENKNGIKLMNEH